MVRDQIAKLTGELAYQLLAKDEVLGSPQAASEFLARAGIDGVKYPVDTYGGKSVKDGDEAGWNYVSFRDDNIRVDHKWTDGQQRYSRRLFEYGNTNVGMAPETAVGETTPGARAANRQRMAEERAKELGLLPEKKDSQEKPDETPEETK